MICARTSRYSTTSRPLQTHPFRFGDPSISARKAATQAVLELIAEESPNDLDGLAAVARQRAWTSATHQADRAEVKSFFDAMLRPKAESLA